MFGQSQQEVRNVGQHDSICLPIYFRFDDAALLWDYRGNASTFRRIDSLLANVSIGDITTISISGSASHEGKVAYNERLSHKRADAFARYLKWKYPQLSPLTIYVGVVSDDGKMLEQAIEEDLSVPNRTKVLEILRRDTELRIRISDVRLFSKESYGYLQKNVFPYFRAALSCVIYNSSQAPYTLTTEDQLKETQLKAKAEEQKEAQLKEAQLKEAQLKEAQLKEVQLKEAQLKETQQKDSIASMAIETNTDTTISILDTPTIQSSKTNKVHEYRTLFAVKTNLLFDLATAFNVEVEVPIGRRWSVAGEWIFPWWLWGDKQICLQVLSGNLEGRYWLGDRNKRALLTGWFAGVYTGAGLYDLEWKRKGYQGEFFVAAGISGGYAHSIGKNLRMEYSLGVGYLNTRYREYNAEFKEDDRWHLFRSKNGTFSWFGPTRLKVSLVWAPPFKFSGKGGKAQ